MRRQQPRLLPQRDLRAAEGVAHAVRAIVVRLGAQQRDILPVRPVHGVVVLVVVLCLGVSAAVQQLLEGLAGVVRVHGAGLFEGRAHGGEGFCVRGGGEGGGRYARVQLLGEGGWCVHGVCLCSECWGMYTV